ncbi:hypothetical protein GCM10009677_37080 [Sphaerisporangium rubeum]
MHPLSLSNPFTQLTAGSYPPYSAYPRGASTVSDPSPGPSAFGDGDGESEALTDGVAVPGPDGPGVPDGADGADGAAPASCAECARTATPVEPAGAAQPATQAATAATRAVAAERHRLTCAPPPSSSRCSQPIGHGGAGGRT